MRFHSEAHSARPDKHVDQPDTFCDKLLREGSLIAQGTAYGFQQGFNESAQDPLGTAARFAATAVVGYGIGRLTKTGGLGSSIAKALGSSMAVGAVADLANMDRLSKIGNSMSGAWESSARFDTHVQNFGNSAGRFMFDSTACMAAGGFGATATKESFAALAQSLGKTAAIIEDMALTGRSLGSGFRPLELRLATADVGLGAMSGGRTRFSPNRFESENIHFAKSVGASNRGEVLSHAEKSLRTTERNIATQAERQALYDEPNRLLNDFSGQHVDSFVRIKNRSAAPPDRVELLVRLQHGDALQQPVAIPALDAEFHKGLSPADQKIREMNNIGRVVGHNNGVASVLHADGKQGIYRFSELEPAVFKPDLPRKDIFWPSPKEFCKLSEGDPIAIMVGANIEAVNVLNKGAGGRPPSGHFVVNRVVPGGAIIERVPRPGYLHEENKAPEIFHLAGDSFSELHLVKRQALEPKVGDTLVIPRNAYDPNPKDFALADILSGLRVKVTEVSKHSIMATHEGRDFHIPPAYMQTPYVWTEEMWASQQARPRK